MKCYTSDKLQFILTGIINTNKDKNLWVLGQCHFYVAQGNKREARSGNSKGRLPQSDAKYTHQVREGGKEDGGKKGEKGGGREGGRLTFSRLQDSC